MVDVVNTFDADTGKFNCPNDGYALDDEAVEDDDQGQEMKTKYARVFLLDINLIRNIVLAYPPSVGVHLAHHLLFICE